MNRTIIRIGLPLVAMLAIGGCGGGGGGGFIPPVAGATSSADTGAMDAFMAYVKALVATAPAAAEPANVTAFDPPTTTEIKEPIATP